MQHLWLSDRTYLGSFPLHLSDTQAGRTPFLANSNNRVAFALLTDAMACTLAQPKSVAHTCGHFLPFLDVVLANIVSKNTGYVRELWQRLWLFILNQLDNEEWSIVQIHHWVSTLTIFWAGLSLIKWLRLWAPLMVFCPFLLMQHWSEYVLLVKLQVIIIHDINDILCRQVRNNCIDKHQSPWHYKRNNSLSSITCDTTLSFEIFICR